MLLSNKQQEEIGKQIIDLLNLKVDRKSNYVSTSYGTKSARGLFLTIEGLLADYWAAQNNAKYQPVSIELRIRTEDESTPYTKFLTFAEANKWFRLKLDNEGFSDMCYRLTFDINNQVEALEGVIDCEPISFFTYIQNPLSNHLNTFWNNCANHDIEKDGYKGLTQDAVDECKAIVAKYMFTDK